jgi:hypothetical protein
LFHEQADHDLPIQVNSYNCLVAVCFQNDILHQISLSLCNLWKANSPPTDHQEFTHTRTTWTLWVWWLEWLSLFLIFLLALCSAERYNCCCDSLLINAECYPNNQPTIPCWDLAKAKAMNLDTSMHLDMQDYFQQFIGMRKTRILVSLFADARLSSL